FTQITTFREVHKNLSSFNIIINITNRRHLNDKQLRNLSREIQTLSKISNNFSSLKFSNPDLYYKNNNPKRLLLLSLKNQNFTKQQKRWHIHHNHHHHGHGHEEGLVAALSDSSNYYWIIYSYIYIYVYIIYLFNLFK